MATIDLIVLGMLKTSALSAYDIQKQVHESISVQGAVKQAKGAIRHYGENSISIKVEKNNQYSTLRADEKFSKGKKSNVLKLVLILPLTFIKSYIFRRGFLNGKRGFITSTVNAFYAFLKEAKLYEAEIKRQNRS